jgi:hypothetical protein
LSGLEHPDGLFVDGRLRVILGELLVERGGFLVVAGDERVDRAALEGGGDHAGRRDLLLGGGALGGRE